MLLVRLLVLKNVSFFAHAIKKRMLQGQTRVNRHILTIDLILEVLDKVKKKGL